MVYISKANIFYELRIDARSSHEFFQCLIYHIIQGRVFHATFEAFREWCPYRCGDHNIIGVALSTVERSTRCFRQQ